MPSHKRAYNQLTVYKDITGLRFQNNMDSPVAFEKSLHYTLLNRFTKLIID